MSPGDVYWAELPEAGPHMIIIVSRAELNRGNRVKAVPVTSKHFERRARLSTCVAFRAGEHGFTKDCTALCDAAGPIPLSLLLNPMDGPVGRLPAEILREVILAIGFVMDAACEPN